MKINGVDIDVTKLLSRQELLDHLMKNGDNDRILADIRERYLDMFGNELVWRYPISDGVHAGVSIVVVKEGFISLPYDIVDKEDYEIFELNDAAMFDEDSLQIFIDDWKMFSDDLIGALNDMLKITQGK